MKLFILLLFLSFTTELTYRDSYGNEFVIENTEDLPKDIDFVFLKNNLNTKHLIENFTQKSYNYRITLIKIKKKSKNKYELKVLIRPLIKNRDDVEETLKYQNPIYYILKTKKNNKKLGIQSVKGESREI